MGLVKEPGGGVEAFGTPRHSGGDVGQEGVGPVVVLRRHAHEQRQGHAQGVAHGDQVLQDFVAGSTVSPPRAA